MIQSPSSMAVSAGKSFHRLSLQAEWCFAESVSQQYPKNHLSLHHHKPGQAPKLLILLASTWVSGVHDHFTSNQSGSDFTITISNVHAEYLKDYCYQLHYNSSPTRFHFLIQSSYLKFNICVYHTDMHTFFLSPLQTVCLAYWWVNFYHPTDY